MPRPSSNKSKQLQLPMPAADANVHILRLRLALEKMRGGVGDFDSAVLLAHTILLTRFITEAGYGRLDVRFFETIEAQIAEFVRYASEAGNWQFPLPLVAAVTEVVNEHDRQLRETRLGVVLKASDRLGKLVAASRDASELFGRMPRPHTAG